MSTIAKGGRPSGRAAGRATHFGARAAHFGRQAARRPTNTISRAGERGAHYGGRGLHHVGRAARPAVSAGRRAAQSTAQNARNAAHVVRSASQGAQGIGQAGGNAAKKLANRVIGRNPNANPQQNQSVAQQARKKMVNKGLRTAGTAFGGVGRVAAEGIILLKDNKRFRDALLYGSLAIILFIISLFLSSSPNPQAAQNAANQNTTNPMQITVSCTPSGTKGADLAVGQKSVCTIVVSDTQTVSDISVVATIYKFAQYDPGSATVTSTTSTLKAGTYNATNDTVTWDAKALKLNLTAPVSLTFTITVTKTTNTEATPIVVNGTPSGGAGGGIPANTNTCGGKYTADISKNWLLKKNFGDPNCDMPDNNTFATYLKQQDPTNGAKWFVVVQCESGYDPNAWNDPNSVNNQGQKTPDAAGAWGLFQDGSSAFMTPASLYGNNGRPTETVANIKTPAGLPMPTWGYGGQWDRGDIDWKTQVANAIQLLKARGWAYWGCS